MVVGAVLTTALIAMNYSQSLVGLFTFFILLATLSTLVPYAFCALAGFLIPDRDGTPIVDGAAVIAAHRVRLLAVRDRRRGRRDVVFWGFILLLAGLPVYVWVRRQTAGAER